MERKGIVTIKGNPLTLVGPELKIGDKAPEFNLVDKELNEVHLKDFDGKIKLISVTPSLDTPVCDIQARRFNQEATGLSEEVAVLNISMDLPFAIARFCASAGIDMVKTLSDHRDASFGTAYGVLTKELRLLARSIFIVDKENIIRYIEIVPEITNHTDYDKALDAVKRLAKSGKEVIKMAGTLKEAACDPACGFSVKSHDEKEIVDIIKQHAKKSHNKIVSDKEVMGMMREEMKKAA